MYRRSNFGNNVSGCLDGMPSPVESGSCVLENSLHGGGCENDSGGPGYKYVGGRPAKYPSGVPAPACCVSNPPKECIGSGTTSRGGGDKCSFVPDRSSNLEKYIDSTGKKVKKSTGVPCNNCGQYYYQHYSTDPGSCYQFETSGNECVLIPGGNPITCPKLPGSKSNFGKKHSGMSPWIIILITLAVFALIVMLMKKKKMFFGKRR